MSEIWYVVVADTLQWSRGQTLKEAAKNADCLNRSKNGIKRGVKAAARKVTVTKPLDAEMLEYYARDYGLDGYTVGDLVKPFVSYSGSVIAIGGEIETVEMGGL